MYIDIYLDGARLGPHARLKDKVHPQKLVAWQGRRKELRESCGGGGRGVGNKACVYMCVYMYARMYVYVYIYVFTYIGMCIYICIYRCIDI